MNLRNGRVYCLLPYSSRRNALDLVDVGLLTQFALEWLATVLNASFKDLQEYERDEDTR